ncbi:forkhead transcription factor X [Strongylocentrotus purpuratus]|uniref:Forkhead transcription factor X n=1 Tax=Strongylocentrotus purpuratus TaxID=7668 RepID=Q2V888_STRPU|nr:forkhead transcription factor X [Strongylocentrotus purpuratus]ABB89481.1 forkhead transcription factor X [Strongylocentrotus purpuratus]|eukprot:NP_001073025.1 forkhead transcription factor X [Strongylocentrotus purpuratus]
MSVDVESLDVDATQLSKLKLYVSGGNDTMSQKTYSTVTPPPSPLDVHGDVDSRPPHSYVRIVIMSLLDCPGHEATIREIYDMITYKFPYYQENRLHWKNSVRHNLTVFSCFERVITEEGSTSRGSNRWRLIGNWRSILEKAEAVSVRKSRPCTPSIVEEFIKKKKKHHHKTSRINKLDIVSRREKDLAKRKKREKARKLRLAAGICRVNRMPLADSNHHDFTTPVKPTEEPLPSRMSTPPPRLPGIENIFLPSPTPSISPLREPMNIWEDAPDDFNLLSVPNLSLIDEITDIISANDEAKVPHLEAQTDSLDFISQYESDIDVAIERQSTWHQFTPEQSPAKAWSELSKAGLNGYTSSAKNKNLWDLVDSTVNPEFLDMYTLNGEWSSTMTTGDCLLVS